MRDPMPNRITYGEDLEEWVDRVIPDALAAADGVMFSEASIEKAVKAVHKHRWVLGGIASDEDIARAVIAALQEEA
ncbi:hypothetical protein [Arthrobacter sp. NA-172]|uniref:hypothetical protein n=1 Tax=Arthrobacter sp. NA-172 TaxID=3367524 RepID=UPI00375499E6